jgi:hypothetical protein
MATSYINTGVLGQVVGGSLGTTGLTRGQEFQQFAAEVQRKKRKLSGPSREEREAARQRREERRTQAVADVGAVVDTADVKVPSIKVDETAPPAVQQAQEAANQAPVGITQTALATPPPAPPATTIAPERSYGESDVAFARAFDAYYQNITTKNASDVRAGAGTLQSQYQAAVQAAQASGRQEYIDIIGRAGAGVAGSKHISAQNVGQAKAAVAGARTSIRGLVDLDEILRSQPAAAAPAAPQAPSPVSVRNARGRLVQTAIRSSSPFRRGR